MEYRMGPSTEPWGTPQERFRLDERQEGPLLLSQIPPHSFAAVTSSCQLTNQARIKNRLPTRKQIRQ